MKPRTALIVATLGAMALGGCKTKGDIVIQDGVGITALRTPCSAVGIPQYLGSITLFSPPDARTEKAIDLTATMTDVKSTCDNTQPSNVITHATFTVLATRTDPHGARQVTLPYFATVIRGNDNVVAKRLGTVTLNFANGKRRATATGTAEAVVNRAAATLPAPIRERITRKRKAGQSDAAVDPLSQPDVKEAVAKATFELMLGFQLTDKQLAFNTHAS